MLTFKANYISSATVQHYDKNSNKYTPLETSFVELRPEQKNDLRSIKDLGYLWYPRALFIDDFENDFMELCRYQNYNSVSKFYALTKQKTGFEDLKAKDILGFTQVCKRKENLYKLDYIQTHPDFMHDSGERQIKHIGKAIMDSVKQLLPEGKSIWLESLVTAEEFYLKQGFKILEPHAKMIFKK